MALCDRGYLCEVCGEEVEGLDDSDLYLRYVLGEVEPEALPNSPERHIRCNPAMAQFIVAEGFPPVTLDGPSSKRELDPEFVAEEEARVTRGYLRLLEIPRLRPTIDAYPLPEVLDRWRGEPADSANPGPDLPATPPE